MKLNIKLLKPILLLLSTFSLGGCLLFAVPAAYAIQQNAQYSQNYDYSSREVYQAVLYKLKSINGVKLTANNSSEDDFNKKIEIKGDIKSDEYKGSFDITIEKITDTSTKFVIRYNIFGDKIKSKEFLDSIEEILENKTYLTK